MNTQLRNMCVSAQLFNWPGVDLQQLSSRNQNLCRGGGSCAAYYLMSRCLPCDVHDDQGLQQWRRNKNKQKTKNTFWCLCTFPTVVPDCINKETQHSRLFYFCMVMRWWSWAWSGVLRLLIIQTVFAARKIVAFVLKVGIKRSRQHAHAQLRPRITKH